MRRVLECGFLLFTCLSRVSLADDPAHLLNLLGQGTKTDSIRQPKEVTRWNDLPSAATSVAFSPDGKTLAIGLKALVQFADVEEKSLTRTISLNSGQVRALAFSPNGSNIATGSYQNVTVFNVETREVVQELKGHRGYVTGLAYSKDGTRLATSCEDELARIWTLNRDAPPILLKGHAYPVTGVAWSPDEKLIATSAGDETRPTKSGQVRIWDAISGELKSQFELHGKAATGVAFSRDGQFLLSTSVDERINVYNVKDNKALGFFGGHSRPTNAVVIHPDEQTAISVSGGRAKGKNELIAWEYETGETTASVEAHQTKVNAVAISPEGNLVATAGQDASVALWNFSFLAAPN